LALRVRTATAFRWRAPTLAGQAIDLVRVREDGGVHLALLANGFECGFSTCWPPASRLALDLFVEDWAATSGLVEDRLADAFERCRRRFAAQAPSLVGPDAEFPDDLPGAVLLAVAIEGKRVHAAWIGGDIAILARGFHSAGATTPHTLRAQFKRENTAHPGDLADVPNVLVRTIGPRSPDQDPPAFSTFAARGGDTVILLSEANFRGRGVPIDEAAFAAAAHANPAVLAERLAELAMANEDSPYAAAAVLRLDGVDVSAEIDRLIDEYRPDPRHGEWLRDWSQEHRALPVYFDMGGVAGLKRDCSVVAVAWDDPEHSTLEETSAADHLTAIVGASRTYATLATLAPRRPPDAQDCPHCDSDNRRGCAWCCYLGWCPPARPAWFHRPLGFQSPIETKKATPHRPW
jgi:hypothetical protein